MPRIRAIVAAALLAVALPVIPAIAGQTAFEGKAIQVQGYYPGGGYHGGYGRPYRAGPRHYAPPPRGYYRPPPRVYYAPQPRYHSPGPRGYYGRPPGGYYRY